jgi:Phospholipase_D-nuclease N-terminal
MLLASDPQSVTAGVWLVVVIAAVVAQLVLFIAGVVSVVRSGRLTGAGRAIWIVAMLVFPLLGPFAWFLFGRRSTAEIYR